MRFELLLIVAVIACFVAAAEDWESKIPADFCSLTATGKKAKFTVKSLGDTSSAGTVYSSIEVNMTRVKNTVRYDFYKKNKISGTIIRALYNDFDTYATTQQITFGFLKINGVEMQACKSFHNALDLEDFNTIKTTGDSHKISSSRYPEEPYFLFDLEDFKIFAEMFVLNWDNKEITFYLEYDSYDYSFVSHNDDIFKIDDETLKAKCDNTYVERPSIGLFAESDAVCGPKKVVLPVLPCTFEVEFGDDQNGRKSVKGMFQNGEGFVKSREWEKSPRKVYSIIMRCDMKNANGECLEIERGFYDGIQTYCRERYEAPNLGDGLSEFVYTGKPLPVNCPDDTPGCWKHCDIGYKYGNRCIVVNNNGALVAMTTDGGGSVVYTGRELDLEEFRTAHCDGTIIEAPESHPCSPSSASFPLPPSLLLIFAVLFLLI